MSKAYTIFVLFLIYLSILNTVIDVRYHSTFSYFSVCFNVIEYFTVFVFTVEYLLRIICYENRLKYIFSFYGMIDALTILPALIGFTVGGTLNPLWLRAIKIFRLVRLLKFVSLSGSIGGIIGNVLPYLAIAIAFKGIIVMLEVQLWWPKIDNLNVVIGVVGFALAVLLGTKLSVVNARIYAIEDAVCRIVGALRDMQNEANIKKDLLYWSRQLEDALTSPVEIKRKKVREMRHETDLLEKKLSSKGIGGPNTAGFHRDVAYLLHRTTAKTPAAYDAFLKYVTVFYTLVVIFAIPSLTGLISTVLLVYTLGGMYFVIEDMDSPLDYGDHSFIDVRLDALQYYNEGDD